MRGMAQKRNRRIRLGLIGGILGLLVAAFAAVHVIVSTQTLRRWINTSPDELFLDYASASSWVPGRIHIRGLTMRGSDRNVQWYFRWKTP